ncbi:hypothetical protein DICPUDRAFT_73840 [Dictyostelium purpureum]|uniref:Uncharacterized protein n=1 Tax=Dictyostelium purpureum TaxID=5786 RepID=F0Z612_DICPU|nr:uncharacterized protein DICPUDRAFT_73840 [Dictyostelium purpureum]EGC40518.1 hypothetical protein DICPUDRAFT_73840 [Dictyostelium purpureum]|eukprot:XP_003282854.1 hypothetical protein DICPUDRAFT_73840 [Dictyostelium purpureum]
MSNKSIPKSSSMSSIPTSDLLISEPIFDIPIENDIHYYFNLLLIGDHDLIDVDNKIYSKKNICIDDKFIRVSIFKHHAANVSWERFKTIRDLYYKNLHGAIFVYDITKQESFQSIIDVWYKQYQDYKILKIHNISDSPYYKSLNNFKPSLLLLGINTDKRNSTNYSTCVSTEKVVDFAKSIDAEFYELPSVNKKNIGFAIFELLKDIKKNYEASGAKTFQEIDKSKCIIN